MFSVCFQENRRLETELLDGAEELEEAQGQILKLQRSLENLMKEKVLPAVHDGISETPSFCLCSFQLKSLCVFLSSCIRHRLLQFGDVDPSSADLLLQEERIKQLRSSYEAQCRVGPATPTRSASVSSPQTDVSDGQELQDRIDELQAELQDLHPLSKGHAPTHKALSEELESQSPGMESDPGTGNLLDLKPGVCS